MPSNIRQGINQMLFKQDSQASPFTWTKRKTKTHSIWTYRAYITYNK